MRYSQDLNKSSLKCPWQKVIGVFSLCFLVFNPWLRALLTGHCTAGIGGLLYMSRRNEGPPKRIQWQRERGAVPPYTQCLKAGVSEEVRLLSQEWSMEHEPWGHAFSPHMSHQPHSLYLRVQCVFIDPVEYLNNRWNNIYFNTESSFWKRFLVLQNTFSFK